mgnify:CR=1 FL=1
MIQEDTYKTITDIAEGIYTEKRSKFIAIAIPVRTIEEIKQHLDTYQKKYYDARHVCYASGTAGKPILGQINSNELTDILIIVVRYFGGIKLGTSGLIVAYKAAAAEAIAAADISLFTCFIIQNAEHHKRECLANTVFVYPLHNRDFIVSKAFLGTVYSPL